MEYFEHELYHWGIKGQKWGRRRYQNKDGSLTPAGQKRYNKEMEKLKSEERKLKAEQKVLATKKKTQAKVDKLESKKAELEAQKKALKEENKAFKKHGKKTKDSDHDSKKHEETLEERRERLLKSADAKELYKNRDILTDAEIAARINRIDLEAKLQSKIVEEKKKTGMEYLDKTLSYYKKVDEVYDTVSKSAIGKTLAKKLGIEPEKKEFNLKDFYKNINKKSDKEIQDASQRVANQRKIEEELKRREKQKEKEAQSKTSKDTKTDKQSEKSKTEESKTERYEGTVEGEGTSKSNIKNDAGKTSNTKPDDYYDPIDAYYTESVSTLPSVNVRRGQTWVDDFLGR